MRKKIGEEKKNQERTGKRAYETYVYICERLLRNIFNATDAIIGLDDGTIMYEQI